MEDKFVTEKQLQDKLQDLSHDLKSHIVETVSKLRDEVEGMHNEIDNIENKTRKDIERLEDKLDEKLSGIGNKIGSNNELLAEIKSILKSREKDIDEIQSDQENINLQYNRQAVEFAVLSNQYKTLYEDIYGSPSKPDSSSLFTTMREINAKISDVLSMAAFHGQEIERIDNEIESYKSIARSLINRAQVVGSFFFSKAGIGTGIAIGLLALAISEGKEIQAVIDFLSHIFTQ